ncbi:hypothetical protein TWF751_002430 [Orbilia oligospora]|nr:hypothetical protein TWF751_002430 [Orbilia oligospora]
MKQIRITKWPRKNRGDEPIDPAQQSFKRPYVKLQEDHQDEQATAPPTIHPHKTSNAQLNDQVPAKPERFAVYGIVDNTVDPALEFHVQTVAYGSQACASLRKLADTSGGRHQLAGLVPTSGLLGHRMGSWSSKLGLRQGQESKVLAPYARGAPVKSSMKKRTRPSSIKIYRSRSGSSRAKRKQRDETSRVLLIGRHIGKPNA